MTVCTITTVRYLTNIEATSSSNPFNFRSNSLASRSSTESDCLRIMTTQSLLNIACSADVYLLTFYETSQTGVQFYHIIYNLFCCQIVAV